ncbi:MAG: translation elongation factor Ts [Planctomycetota bacterium]
MAEITAQLVRQLRETSGAGMMECKKALTATNGDLDAALDELRKAGLKSAAKKVGRETAEGRVGLKISDDGTKGAIVALATETDFLASTPDFTGFLDELVAHAFENEPKSAAEMLEQSWHSGGTVQEALTAKIGDLKENLQIVDAAAFSNGSGRVAGYVHHDNKKGALVNVTTGADAAKANDVLKKLSMHIVVFSPSALDESGVEASEIEREKEIIKDGLAGKPEDIQNKIMEGRLQKFFAERTLVGQPWIDDDKQSVAKALVAELGDGTKIEAYQRSQLGE